MGLKLPLKENSIQRRKETNYPPKLLGLPCPNKKQAESMIQSKAISSEQLKSDQKGK
jgi:hypothetical protein